MLLPVYPRGTALYPFYGTLDGFRGRSGRHEKSRPHRISIPGTPARSKSLYQLSYRNRRKLSVPADVKVKCTLVQALRLCTGRKAHRGSRGIALLFHDQRH